MKSIGLLLLAMMALAPLAMTAENTIYLHHGKLVVRMPSDWAIIGHRPLGERTTVVVQLLMNKAEEGTEDSTNLIVTAYNLKDTEAMLTFIKPLSTKAVEGETDSVFEVWAIRDWQGQQGDTNYHISDARLVHDRLAIGIHVRLAWPLLKDNPADYDEEMTKLLHRLLADISKRNPDTEKVSGADSDMSETADPPK